MNASRRNIAAFSLIELLVVLAIVALLAGISVPTLTRLGVFSFNKVDAAARDVFGVMRAARMYAATNRVDTAVVYAVLYPEPTNTLTDPVIDGIGVARQMTEREITDAGVGTSDASENRRKFVMVSSSDAQFRKLPHDTCVALHPDPAAWLAMYGFEPIDVMQNDGGMLSDLYPRDPDTRFYAHVFAPSGETKCTYVERMRCQLTVTNMPGPGNAEDEIRFAGVELQMATGRPKLVEVNP